MSITTKKIVMVKQFEGLPKLSDFEIIEETLPPLRDCEILTEAEWISVDPYIRAYSSRIPPGNTVIGGQIARVIQSRHPDYKVDDIISANLGWQTHCVVAPDDLRKPRPDGPPLYKLPDFGGLPHSLGLGVLGMPGNTALFALNDICQPKPGQIIAITGAAGAVGSTVAQIAKHRGCIVIGFAGSDRKVNYLMSELKLDAAFNYKTVEIASTLAKIAPQGIDIYFDNVGGEISSIIMYHMKSNGRVAVVGSISTYNADAKTLPKASVVQPAIVMKQLLVQGFHVWGYGHRFVDGIKENLTAIREGWLKFPEQVFEGFDQLPTAFIDMLQGGNIGKTVVKITQNETQDDT